VKTDLRDSLKEKTISINGWFGSGAYSMTSKIQCHEYGHKIFGKEKNR
jgi:hypothetical protein